uniref:DED domain-containing protein n=1 Tax=Callorhinchus milii TaxID=7868 RepID=A0A4W3GPM8_CALMI
RGLLSLQGVAVGVGFCAATHLDDTLGKLEDFGKSDIVRKTSSLFNILKDKADVEVEKVRSTLILCYGYVSLHGPEQLILPRIQTHIVRLVLSHFNTKDLTVKLSLLRAVSLIARAVYSNTANQTFTFSHKGELLHLLQDLIKAEPPDVLRTPIRQHAITASLHLLKLDPMLSEADLYELITTCLGSVFSLPPRLATEKGKEEAITDMKEREVMYTDALTALQELLMQILLQDLSPDGLQAVFKHIEPWLSARDHERERATETTSKLLAFYLDKLNIRVSTDTMGREQGMGVRVESSSGGANTSTDTMGRE